MTYDLAILGGGPAGVAGGVYAARKRLKTVFITKDWNGQSAVSEGIENWIGEIKIGGYDLAKKLEMHLKAYAPGIIDIKEGEWIQKIERLGIERLKDSEIGAGIKEQEIGKNTDNQTPITKTAYKITTDKNTYEARTILITTGSSRRKLEILGAEQYDNKGLTYCATCDGPLYADKDVAVVGGGNAAFESAAQLMAYCRSVTLVNRSDSFKADPGTVETVSKNPKVKIVTNAISKAVKGDRFVTSFVYTDAKTNTDVELPVSGIFVEIGSIPNTVFAKDMVKLDQYGRVPVDARNQRAMLSDGGSGMWAAGDVTDGLFHQNNIAAGDAVKAIEDIYLFLNAKGA